MGRHGLSRPTAGSAQALFRAAQLSRLSRPHLARKAPDLAIRIAKASGLPLRIAAKVPRQDNRYFREQIKPLLDAQTEFVGEGTMMASSRCSGAPPHCCFPSIGPSRSDW